MTKKKFYKMLLSKGIQRNEAEYMTLLAARARFLQGAGYGVMNLEWDYSYQDFLNDRMWLARTHYYYSQSKHKKLGIKQLKEAANIVWYHFSYK